MKVSLGVLLVLASLPLRVARADDLELQPGTKIVLASREEAQKLLVERDVFVQALSPFDRAARLKTDKDVPEKAYLEFVGAQALEWTEEEKTRLTALWTDLRPRVAPLKLSLPPVIRLVKTTGKEEGGAAYCRGASIVLPQKMLAPGSRALDGILPHELFHIYSSHNAKRRGALYGVVGFALCEPVSFPEALAKRKLTNPDAPGMDTVIQVKDGERRVPAIPILYSRTETYDTARGGEFFDSMEVRLMVLEKDGTALKPVLDAKGQPRLLKIEETPDYLEQVGKNTGYTIHPEEILAENFRILLMGKKNVPSPAILEGLRRVLAEAAAK